MARLFAHHGKFFKTHTPPESSSTATLPHLASLAFALHKVVI